MLGASVLLLGHVLPDGVVERSVQVTVYPDRLEIRYQVGFNPKTLARQLQQLAPHSPVPDDPNEALARYRELVLPRLAQRLNVRVDGQQREVLPIEARRIFRHHAQLECVLHVPLEAPYASTRLQLEDENFPDALGSHRMAVKGRAGVEVTESNVPPILARAERIEAAKLDPEQLASRRVIKARFQRVDSAVVEAGNVGTGNAGTDTTGADAGQQGSDPRTDRDESVESEASAPTGIVYHVADDAKLDPLEDADAGTIHQTLGSSGRIVLLVLGVAGLALGAVLFAIQRMRRG